MLEQSTYYKKDTNSPENLTNFNVSELIIAGDKGPCGGVYMAVETTMEVLSLVNGREAVYSNNPPIHNEPMLAEFIKRGLIMEPDLNKIPDGAIVILSAHGTKPTTVETLRERDMKVINTECPLVSKDRRDAQAVITNGGFVIYRGAVGHPEPTAVTGDLPQDRFIFMNEKNSIAFLDLPDKPITVLNQTTLSTRKARVWTQRVRQNHPERIIDGPIGDCYATDNRQDSVMEGLFGDPENPLDLLLVVGSKISHNSQELANIGREILGEERTHLIDGLADIDASWFETTKRVGITSGASVMDEILNQVIVWFMQKGVKTIELSGREKERKFKKPMGDIDGLRRYLASRYN